MTEGRMNKKEMIKEISEQLSLPIFSPIGIGAGCIELVQKFPTGRIEKINITYSVYPGVYYLKEYISGDISFPEVESLIDKYYRKYRLNYEIRTVYKTSQSTNIDRIELVSVSDIPSVIPYLRDMVYDDILPFFDKYQTLTQVYEELERLGDDIPQVNKFIFSPQPIRRMIIKRLVNDPQWEEFGKKTVNNYIKNSTGPYAATFAPFAQFLPELFQELQEMKV